MANQSLAGQCKLSAGSAIIPNLPQVRGVNLDAQTRCEHYHGPTDVVAIKMKCCGVYYSCKDCHDALAAHPIEVWPQSDLHQRAILCGACGAELTINQYMQCEFSCPACRADFNPGCRNHYHFYFSVQQPSKAE
jgi:uncharacterized CHY-type Zn-finger protein